jgi:hypothetical protein
VLNFPFELAAGIDGALHRRVDIIDGEIKMDRRPVSPVVARDLSLRTSRSLHDPASLFANLHLRPIGLLFDHRQTETAPIELNRAIHVINVDAD